MSDQLNDLRRRLATNYQRYQSNKSCRRNWLKRMMASHVENYTDDSSEPLITKSENNCL